MGGGDSGGGQQGTTSTGVPFYTPVNTGAADTAWLNALNGLQNNNWYGALNPQYQAFSTQGMNNPFATGAQSAAENAGQVAGNAGSALNGLSGLFANEAQSLAPGMSSVMNMGFDPQGDLYTRTLQRLNDQANVTNAQYGLTGQQAAGNVQQLDSNFNIDWQNQQLSRALQGISGAGNIAQEQAGLGQAIGQAGTGGSTLTALSGTLPYAQYGSNLGQILQYLSGAAGFGNTVGQNPQAVMSSIIPYLNYGSGATNAGVNAAGANTAANTAAGAGIGSALQGLSGLFGGNSPFGNTGFNAASNADFSGANFGSPTNAGSQSNLDWLSNMPAF